MCYICEERGEVGKHYKALADIQRVLNLLRDYTWWYSEYRSQDWYVDWSKRP